MQSFQRWGIALMVLLAGSALVSAQTATPSGSTVNFTFFACEDRAVIDLTGNMLPNQDLFVQVFGAADGGGDPFSSLLRVAVDGDYQVSVTIPYPPNRLLGQGQFGSATIAIASETDPTREFFTTTVNDLVDNCPAPSFPSVDTSTPGDGSTAAPGELIDSSGIRAPGGGFLNPVFAPPAENLVQIGARPSDQRQPAGRTANPGLIFAECSAYPKADPGLIYDTDTILVFWSWFARTRAEMQDHLDNAQYSITLNGQTFPSVNISTFERRPGSANWWTFYTVNLGHMRPGEYGIAFKVEWDEAISDGFEDFGPGTDNVSLNGGCTFQVERNPYGIEQEHDNPGIPLRTF
jgi:hypothetical protein